MRVPKSLPPVNSETASRNFERFLAELEERETPCLPQLWTPEYVGQRLVEACDALYRWRTPVGPRRAQSATLDVWQGDLTPNEIADITRFHQSEGSGRRSPPPTKRALERAERAIEWPMKFLKNDADASACVVHWAYWRARDFDVSARADRFYAEGREGFDAQRKAGLAIIARGLNAAKIFPD